MNRDDGVPNFEVGLVLAGAVSAGAYTAGVLDFLFHALEEWESARSQDGVPPHRVTIRVMTGTSAGGVTAALAAVALCGDWQPARSVPAPEKLVNPLYDLWVRGNDISPLLRADDLPNEVSELVSVFDSTVLEAFARKGLEFQLRPEGRAYLDDPLHIILTVTNLRGVPYHLDLESGDPRGHAMSSHADRIEFALTRKGRRLPGAHTLDATSSDAAEWEFLGRAALASGALPIGLAPHVLQRPASDYSAREWPIALARPERDPQGQLRCEATRRIPPAWDLPPGSLYDFTAVDGGVMNNEPFEYARRSLARGGRNARDPETASRAVLMVDPFPERVSFGPEHRPSRGLFRVALQTLASLRAQARFKPEELALAMDEKVASRFLVAPTREGAGGKEFPLASGALGAWAGLLDRGFREHDFQLGRRNCQCFLERHFVLPERNALFDGWAESVRRRYAVERDGQTCLPVIPRVGVSQREVPHPAWPRITAQQLEAIEDGVKRRLRVVIPRAIHQANLPSGLPWMLRALWWTFGRKLAPAIGKHVEAELSKRGQA